MATANALNQLDRRCDAPLVSVTVPEGYTHYPVNDEDMTELLQDLKEYAGLNSTNAAHTLGYAAMAALANCENIGTIMGMLQRSWIDEWGNKNLTSHASHNAYVEGIDLAVQEMEGADV